jgi:hypothetical protein
MWIARLTSKGCDGGLGVKIVFSYLIIAVILFGLAAGGRATTLPLDRQIQRKQRAEIVIVDKRDRAKEREVRTMPQENHRRTVH